MHVRYGLGESVSTIRTNGWDWAYCPLYLTTDQMHLIAANMEEPGTEMRIASIEGRVVGGDDITESEDQLYHRVTTTLQDLKERFCSKSGEHCICVAHRDTMRLFVQHYGANGNPESQIFDQKHCSFTTLAVATPNCYWLRTRCRTKIVLP